MATSAPAHEEAAAAAATEGDRRRVCEFCGFLSTLVAHPLKASADRALCAECSGNKLPGRCRSYPWPADKPAVARKFAGLFLRAGARAMASDGRCCGTGTGRARRT